MRTDFSITIVLTLQQRKQYNDNYIQEKQYNDNYIQEKQYNDNYD